MTLLAGAAERYQRAVVTASAKRFGVFAMHAAVGSSNYDPALGNRSAFQRVSVEPPPPPPRVNG